MDLGIGLLVISPGPVTDHSLITYALQLLTVHVMPGTAGSTGAEMRNKNGHGSYSHAAYNLKGEMDMCIKKLKFQAVK